jgi:hypothetical protein
MQPASVIGHPSLRTLAIWTLCEGPQTDEARRNTNFRGHRYERQLDDLLERWNKAIRKSEGFQAANDDNGHSPSVFPSPSSLQRHAIQASALELPGSQPSQGQPSLRSSQSQHQLHRHDAAPTKTSWNSNTCSPYAHNSSASAWDVRLDRSTNA